MCWKANDANKVVNAVAAAAVAATAAAAHIFLNHKY